MITEVELYKALRKVPSGKENSRQRILIELYMRGQGASQKDLVNALDMRPATVSEQLDILIEQGYVTKHIDFMDKRVSIIGLTSKGEKLGKDLSSSYEDYLKHIFSELSDVEKDELFRLLQKLSK
ncbi:MarR family winged helix-turn-helix transcriptional regulator [Veillonella sp. AS16]|uniref:MarR family winged helix-turn-helix transcriptional regulator n=1 Tax=Veillonella sp. AS16 TaxID=936589 RepID=UPI0003E26ABE|nr:MarR family winged helix-turn-helix transcriptional regulator [Veillonella sp. AS16]ETS93488.1 winged helix DNA-binding domain protein [Veillonella sp. AS16]